MAEDRTRQTAAKLHTAGPNIPDRDNRLDLLCPAAFGLVPAGARRVTRTYPEWSGLKVVATASRTGTGRDQPRCAVMGSGVIYGHVPCYRLGIPHRFATTLYKGTVAVVRESALMANPNSSYNEYTCYTIVLLCQ